MAFFPAITGNIAHNSSDSGNPVKIGAKAVSSLEGITAVTTGFRTDLYADVDGVAVTKLNTTFADLISERIADASGTSTAFTNFNAGGTGVRNYVVAVIIWNSSSTDGYLDLRNGTTGSILATFPAPKAGGSVVVLPVPLRQTSSDVALAYDVSGALSTVYITVIGFQSKL